MSSAHSYSKAGGFLAMTSHIKLIILVVLGVGLGRTAEAQIERRDFLIPGGSGWLHVREVRDHRNVKPRNLILLHGGGPGGVPSFDLPVAGYSLAEDFVKRGFRVFVMDVRGWGSSTKPHEMDEPPQNSAPLVSTKEAADDIETVVDWVVHRTHEKTALLGWANGGHWACAYSSRGAAALSAVILLNTLYSVNAPWELRPSMQNKENPEQFDHHAGGYRIVDRSGLLRRWDTSIPSADKAEWRDPAVADAYVWQTLGTDPTASTRNPPSVRIPIGYQACDEIRQDSPETSEVGGTARCFRTGAGQSGGAVCRITRFSPRIKGVLMALETHGTIWMAPQYPASKLTPRVAESTHGDEQKKVDSAYCAFVKPT